MLDSVIWFIYQVFGGFTNFLLLFTPSTWQDFPTMEWIAHLIYYGASTEFFFIIFNLFVIFLALGLWKHNILWGVIRVIEKINNSIGRLAAWAVLIMVLQQVMIIALQRIFRLSEISVGPFGLSFTRDLSWYSEELKLYNAIIVTLCAAYTFIQGGHVRVDLFYSSAKYRTKRIIDMFGSLCFVLPFMTIVWLFGWAFLWRHLVTPKVATTNTLDQILARIRVMKWNVETIGFSPNGFDGYFLFKVLLVAFAALMFLQGIAFFYRNLLEYIEGPDSFGKYSDRDADLEPPENKIVADVTQTQK